MTSNCRNSMPGYGGPPGSSSGDFNSNIDARDRMFRQGLIGLYGNNRANATLIYDYNTGRSTPGMRQAWMNMQSPRGAAMQRGGHGGWY